MKTEMSYNMVQTIEWTGNNLREVINFIGGLHHNFNKWFESWDAYEEYVRNHNNILKLFTDESSHYEIYVGCVIEKNTERAYNRVKPITEGKYRLIKRINLSDY